jgi:hypothetical protein
VEYVVKRVVKPVEHVLERVVERVVKPVGHAVGLAVGLAVKGRRWYRSCGEPQHARTGEGVSGSMRTVDFLSYGMALHNCIVCWDILVDN